MRLFDHHIHMSARTTDDYQAMAEAGIVAVIEPSSRLGQPRIHVGSFEDHFLSLVGWERFRARRFGIHHFCTLGLNPREANDPELSSGVLEKLLPIYLEKDGVVGVGEIGLDEQTPAEVDALETQLDLAVIHGLPVLIHTPRRDKVRGTRRILEIIRAHGFDEERVLIDHNVEETLPIVLNESRCWAGHTIRPSAGLDEVRMTALVKRFGAERITVNSSADWGVSDPLKVPKSARAMLDGGIAEDEVRRIVWDNPVAFFAQSERLDSASLESRPLVEPGELDGAVPAAVR